jgi:hypothetical protein
LLVLVFVDFFSRTLSVAVLEAGYAYLVAKCTNVRFCSGFCFALTLEVTHRLDSVAG